jgi:hypothetical protein
MKAKILSCFLVLFFVSFGIALAGEKQLTLEWEQESSDLPENGGDLDHWELFSTTNNTLPFDQWKKEGDIPYTGPPPFDANFNITAPDGQETNFWFKMTAVDAAGNASQPSDVQEGAPTLIDFKPPLTPILSADYNSQNKTVTLTWNTDPDASRWDIFKSSTAGGPYTKIGSGTSPFAYQVKPSDSGKWLYFVVVAFDNSGNFSPNSNEVAVKLSMGVPFNLRVTVQAQ